MIKKVKNYWKRFTLLAGAWQKISNEDYYEEFLQPNYDVTSKSGANKSFFMSRDRTNLNTKHK